MSTPENPANHLNEQQELLLQRLLEALRWEYKDGCRDRKHLDTYLARWHETAERHFATSELREYLGVLRPILKGYATLSLGERQHLVVSVGQQLKMRMQRVKPSSEEMRPAASSPEGSAFPPAGRGHLNLHDEIQYLKGVGPQLGARLKKLGLRTVEDLLMHLPRRWEDRSSIRPICSLRNGAVETVRGVLGPFRTQKPRPGMQIIKATLTDNSGIVYLTWFNQPHIEKTFTVGSTLTATGKVEQSYGEWQMVTPETETGQDTMHSGRIVPIYPLTSNLSQKLLRKIQYHAVPSYAPKLVDPLPEPLLEKYAYPSRAKSVLADWAAATLAAVSRPASSKPMLSVSRFEQPLPRFDLKRDSSDRI